MQFVDSDYTSQQGGQQWWVTVSGGACQEPL